MKRLFRWLAWIVAALVVLVVLLILAKDALLKRYVQYRLRQETGGEVSIGRFEISLLKPTLRVEKFRLDNPPELGGGPFLIIPDLQIEYDPAAARRQELHLTSALLHLAEINVVTAPNQKSLLERLQERIEHTTNANLKVNFTGIDTLTLTVGRISERKLKSGKVEEINVGITNRVLKNVRSEADLAPLLVEALVRQFMRSSTSPPAQN